MNMGTGNSGYLSDINVSSSDRARTQGPSMPRIIVDPIIGRSGGGSSTIQTGGGQPVTIGYPVHQNPNVQIPISPLVPAITGQTGTAQWYEPLTEWQPKIVPIALAAGAVIAGYYIWKSMKKR
jgi:hypothetical protein